MTNEEYPGWGGLRYNEPCVKVTLADGTRDLVLDYVSHEIRGDTLEIHTKDIRYALTGRFALPRLFRARESGEALGHSQSDQSASDGRKRAVGRLVRARGRGLPAQLSDWPLGGRDATSHREPVQPGKKVLESRRGNTSHMLNPWFALDHRGADADEEHGRVWFGAIGWSGNWKLVIEETPAQQVRVTGGFNDFDFGYLLKPGESLETPAFYGGFTDGGFGESSRMLHAFERDEILPDRAAPHPRPVLYNSWEATTFNVNEAGQKELADKAARIGVELFVMDDGWFGQRNDDHAGLGDWYVNPQKFPNGLKA